jgi:hypothetical protein
MDPADSGQQLLARKSSDGLLDLWQRRADAFVVEFVAAMCLCGAVSWVLSDMVVAQSPSIAGRVLDTRGQSIPGVSITLTEATAGIVRYGTSASDGGYRFDTVPDGTYRVDFDLPGFDLFRWSDVRVSGGATANADATMSVSALCECVSIPRGRLVERAGQVVSESGRPLPYARLEIVSPTGREVVRADREGRFRVRVPAGGTWPITAADSGFDGVTQQVSGTVSGPVMFTLSHAGMTGLPYSERITRACRCPGDLFVHPGR